MYSIKHCFENTLKKIDYHSRKRKMTNPGYACLGANVVRSLYILRDNY